MAAENVIEELVSGDIHVSFGNLLRSDAAKLWNQSALIYQHAEQLGTCPRICVRLHLPKCTFGSYHSMQQTDIEFASLFV